MSLVMLLKGRPTVRGPLIKKWDTFGVAVDAALLSSWRWLALEMGVSTHMGARDACRYSYIRVLNWQ